MPINWKEILVNAGLPLLETVEGQVVETSLDDYAKKHPDAFKKLLPLALPILKELMVVFANSKIPFTVLEGLVAGMEAAVVDNKITL